MPKNSHKQRKVENHAWPLAYIFIILAGVIFAALIHDKASKDYAIALDYYRKTSYEEAKITAEKLEDATRQIYQNIRTISLLPSVRKIDRRAAILTLTTTKPSSKFITIWPALFRCLKFTLSLPI
ncbi:MAG: hypothetical protein HOP36_09775 [Methyloglobulus sp.]|nr:hypothetical protein [Methyloglobulus sp.]